MAPDNFLKYPPHRRADKQTNVGKSKAKKDEVLVVANLKQLSA